MQKKLKLEDLEEEIKVTIHKKAFEAKKLHCNICDKEMTKSYIDVDIPETSLSIHLEAFRCQECGKEYLNGEQAKKLDRAFALSNVISRKGVIYERAGNFDGSNVFVRFPAQMIKSKNVRAEIMPISSSEFFVHFKKQKN
ncbi:hypothetical protein HYX16_05200 [Candidatus Woesearchaeota archaeon]|nr:hypothetical protein [Candidatus Woesearchaeota archaeon]